MMNLETLVGMKYLWESEGSSGIDWKFPARGQGHESTLQVIEKWVRKFLSRRKNESEGKK